MITSEQFRLIEQAIDDPERGDAVKALLKHRDALIEVCFDVRRKLRGMEDRPEVSAALECIDRVIGRRRHRRRNRRDGSPASQPQLEMWHQQEEHDGRNHSGQAGL